MLARSFPLKNPLYTKLIIKLAIYPEGQFMQFLQPFIIVAVPEFLKDSAEFLTCFTYNKYGGHIALYRVKVWRSHPVRSGYFDIAAFQMSIYNSLMLLWG